MAAQIAAVATTNLGPGRDKILLRGVSDGAFTGRARSTVATYLDDAPITYNAPDPDLVLTDVERVEVLRGPQGALYGGGSIGGVFRIVTRAPDFASFGGELRLRGSSVNGGGMGGGGELTVNAPILDGRAALRGSLYDIEDPGFLRNDELKQSDVDRTRRKGGRLALKARLGGGWSVTISGAAQRLESADSQYTTPRRGGLQRRSNVVSESHTNDFAEGQVVLTGPVGGFDLHSSTSFVHHRSSSRYDATSALNLFDAPAAAFGVYAEGLNSEFLVQDAYLASPAERPVSVVAGALLSALRLETPSTLSARVAGASTPVQLFSEQRRDHVDEQALYGDLRLRLASDGEPDSGAARLSHAGVNRCAHRHAASRRHPLATARSRDAGPRRQPQARPAVDAGSPPQPLRSRLHRRAGGGLQHGRPARPPPPGATASAPITS